MVARVMRRRHVHVADPLVVEAVKNTKGEKQSLRPTRQQVGPYYVQGNSEKAEIFERRMGKDFLVKSFDTTVADTFQLTTNGVDTRGSDSFKVAVQWAIDNG